MPRALISAVWQYIEQWFKWERSPWQRQMDHKIIHHSIYNTAYKNAENTVMQMGKVRSIDFDNNEMKMEIYLS